MANAYPRARALAEKYLTGQIVDVSTSSSGWIVVPGQGIITDAYCAISAALTTANGTITIKNGSTTLGTITLTQVGSAAGSVFTATFTGSESSRSVKAGDVIEFATDGACDTTSIGALTMVVKET